MDEVNLDLDDMDHAFRQDNNYISRTQSTERMAPSVFYRKVVQDWQERNMKRLEEMSQSSPNLCHVPYLQRPPRPGRAPPSSRFGRDLPRAPVRRSQTMLESRLREKMSLHDEVNTTSTDTLPPLPPPRTRVRFASTRSLAPSRSLPMSHRKIEPTYFDPMTEKAELATDGLYWKPFSWKSGRCRSLTEIYVRKCANREQPVESSLSYKLTSKYCAPPRPPPLEGRGDEPLYSTIHRLNQYRPLDVESVSEDYELNNGNNYLQKRPLPTPPLPPRLRRKFRSRSGSPSSPLPAYHSNHEAQTFIRSVSPFGIPVRDVCVNTSSENLSTMAEKEVQTSFEDIPGEDCHSSDSDTAKADNSHRSTNQGNDLCSENQGDQTAPGNEKAAQSEDNLGKNRSVQDDQSKTSASVYYDAEGCDTDMDVFTELDSYSEATVTSSQFYSLADQSDSINRSNMEASKDQKPLSSPKLPANRASGARNSLDQNAALNSSQFAQRDVRETSAKEGDDSEDEMMGSGRTSQTEIRACIQRRTIGGRGGSFNSDEDW